MAKVLFMVNTLSIQYAKALFDLASEKHEIVDTYHNLFVLTKVINESPDFMKIILSPRLNIEEKKQVVKKVFGNKEDDYFLHFIYVLIDNGRFSEIVNICDAFKELLDEHHQTMEVDVYTKYKLNDKQNQALINKLEKHFAKKITINYVIDPDLLAGIKIVAKGKILDLTLDSQLLSIKESIMKG